MAKDKHLDTGEYEPEKYWDARAGTSGGADYRAVCVHGASEVENETAHRVQKRAIFKALKGVELSGKNVLEFGCGVGRWIEPFRYRGAVWHGVDISSEMLSIAKSRGDDVELGKVVDNRIPHPDAAMDLLYSITVIQHNPHDVQEALMAEMARVLKDGGHLLLLEDLRGGEDFNMFPRSAGSWVELARRHGFDLLRQEGISYWIIRRAVAKMFRPVGLRAGGSGRREGLWRALNRLDMILDPYIYHLMPSRADSTAVFLFRKTGGGNK